MKKVMNYKQNLDSTPLMQQYQVLKSQCPDCILLYRVGDFYETFMDDAKIVSEVLGLTLTSRNHGAAGDVPLAGFPVHALEKYITKLVNAGYKVAIGEQVEDPKKAKTIVKREIIEIITPGTKLSENLLEEASFNYITAIYIDKDNVYIAYTDITTDTIIVDKISYNELENYLLKLSPSEVLISEGLKNDISIIKLKLAFDKNVLFSYIPDYYFYNDLAISSLKEYFNIQTLEKFGMDDTKLLIPASVIIAYFSDTKKIKPKHFRNIQKRSSSEFLEIDYNTFRNLEILEPLHSDDYKSTLFNILKRTSTPMGTRLLKLFLTYPLKNKEKIKKRLEAVEFFYKDSSTREKIIKLLKQIYDIERISNKLIYRKITPKDLLTIKQAIPSIKEIKEILEKNCKEVSLIKKEIIDNIENLTSEYELIHNSINEKIIEGDKRIIKEGFSQELDSIIDKIRNSKKYLIELEQKERERTKINSLKIKYNKVFGYYIEIPKTQIHNVPDDYIRKQTLVNAERYITEELKKAEEIILFGEEKVEELENEIYNSIIEKLSKSIEKFQNTSKAIALLDVLISFSIVAIENHYTKPEITETDRLFIKNGRHPVIEKIIKEEKFIPNDTYLDKENQIMIITGPNMAGKSTYLRQVALIVFLAHIGSFVPAEHAEISIVDKIFSRIGAYDRLSKGQSTFLVEMSEVANILNNATNRSLVILDEVGRGTSTFDGLSLAWAIVEYLHNEKNRNPKTLFATHYHELTEIEEILPKVKNYNIAIKREDDKLIFLRKLVPGSVSDSYGIDVAKLAGVPQKVIERAKEILNKIEKYEISIILDENETVKNVNNENLTLFNNENLEIESILTEIKKLNLNNMTPIEALNYLFKLQNRVKKI